MSKKTYTTWQRRFFQLKNACLYWYTDESASSASNHIDLKGITKAPFIHKPGKFTIESHDKRHVYKFECTDNDECQEWVEAIKSEMMSFHGEKKIVQLTQIEPKKKIITNDGAELPNIYSYKKEIKMKVYEALKTENFFSFKKR